MLTEYTRSDSLIKHALAVESAVRGYARECGEGELDWGIVGLIHDFDYEKWPDPENHPFRGAEILREKGYPEHMIRARARATKSVHPCAALKQQPLEFDQRPLVLA